MATAPCSTSSAAAAARVPRSSAARVARSSASAAAAAGTKKLTCLCSPTNHPGSFRCSRHRNGAAASGGGGGVAAVPGASRGGTGTGTGTGRAAKGRSVRALLLQRIGSVPCERRHRRRGVGDFQPRPSRLRLMNL